MKYGVPTIQPDPGQILGYVVTLTNKRLKACNDSLVMVDGGLLRMSAFTVFPTEAAARAAIEQTYEKGKTDYAKHSKWRSWLQGSEFTIKMVLREK